MAETSPPARTFQELTEPLRQALLADTPAFFNELYHVEGLDDDDLRPLVATTRDDSMRFFRMAREKLNPRNVEIKDERQRQSSWIVQFVVNHSTILEVTIDDIYEQNGKLHTRDVIRLTLR